MKYNVIYAILIALLLLFSCGSGDNPQKPRHLLDSTDISTVLASEFQDSLNYVMGKFDPDTSQLFIEIPREMADRAGLYLRKEALSAFRQMREHAQRDGIELVIRSATRNFDYQKGIWERKWTGETKVSGENLSKTKKDPYERARTILLYSSMPGSSRHHWGTDIDLNMFENEWFEVGEGLRLYEWLQEHAHDYGFCQPYTEKSVEGRTGYEEEKWHWSYMPISMSYTAFAKANLKNEMIKGFAGDSTAATIDIVQNYVLGISEACMNN